MSLLIKNGRIIDPIEDRDGVYDIFIEDGIVKKIGKDLNLDAARLIDASNKWVVPGLIDVHVHLREPGFEHKETIETGARAAARGGFTTICPMPNTSPPIDSKSIIDYVNKKSEDASINILPVGAITIGQDGKDITNMPKMKKAGIWAVSDDGKSVMDAKLLKEAMELAKANDLPMLSHCEDMTLMGGSMNEGENSRLFGLKGIGKEAEDIITARDIILANTTGVKLHLCHVSTKLSLDIIRFAKSMGANITAETAPHYFILTDERVKNKETNTFDTNAKMSPPLRTKEDLEAMKEALKDNTIDMIATDHAPHHVDEKDTSFASAPFGIVGLETSFALSYTYLVEAGLLTPLELIEKMSANPAKLIGLDKGTIGEGKVADIAIIDPNKEYLIDSNKFASKARNTPFNGVKVKGQIDYTIVGGETAYKG